MISVRPSTCMKPSTELNRMFSVAFVKEECVVQGVELETEPPDTR